MQTARLFLVLHKKMTGKGKGFPCHAVRLQFPISSTSLYAMYNCKDQNCHLTLWAVGLHVIQYCVRLYVARQCVWRYAQYVPWHALLIAASTFALRTCNFFFSHDDRTLDTFTLAGVLMPLSGTLSQHWWRRNAPDFCPCRYIVFSFTFFNFFFFLHFTFGLQCNNIIFNKSYCSTVHFCRISKIYQPTNAHIVNLLAPELFFFNFSASCI